MSRLVDRFNRQTLSAEELRQLRNVAHAETAAKIWKSLTKEDHITILRHGTLQSEFRRVRGDDQGDCFLLVEEESLAQAEAKFIEDLSNVVQTQNPWGRDGSNDSIFTNLVSANKTDLALKILTLFAATAFTKPLVENLFRPPQSSHNEATKNHEQVTGSLLTIAAKNGCLVTFKEYLSNAVLNQKRGPNEDTLLHIAVEHGNIDDVRELLLAGATCNLNVKSWTPLHSAAAAKKPNAAIASQLVQQICRVHGASYINQSSTSGNTALHIAAYNVNMTADFLYQLRDADPFSVNEKGLTALEVAAAASDNPEIIVAMLDVFLPIMSRAELNNGITLYRTAQRNENGHEAVGNATILPVAVKEMDKVKAVRFKLMLRTSLLETCVRNGLVDAVVTIIEHGTDLSNILHVIVAESVAHPENIDKFKAIYRSIVDQVMRPKHWWLKTNGIGFFEEDVSKDVQIKEAIQLVESPSELFQGLNAIELAIHIGAREMLEEIVNTFNVYRFENYMRTSHRGAKIRSDRVEFDVTNMTNEKFSRRSTSSPKTCYLEAIVNHGDIWRDSDILDKEPFKKLTVPHAVFVQRAYLLMGVIQLIFMIILSVYHIPDTCSLNEQFGLNISWCYDQEYGSCAQQDDILLVMSLVNCIRAAPSATFIRTYPNGAWLIWPIVLCIFFVSSVTHDIITWLLSMRFKRSTKWFSIGCCCCCSCCDTGHTLLQFRSLRPMPKTKTQSEPALFKLLAIALKHFPHLAFSVSVFVWYSYYKNTMYYPLFLEALSVVFLFGWILTFFHLSGIHKHTYMFSLILKEIIIKDIFSNFMPIFVFTVVGFGFAMHVLQQTVLPADTVASVNVTIYNTFLSTVNIGNMVQATFDPFYYIVNGRLGFYRVMFAIYVSFATIILLQVLVSMLTNRYHTATGKAAYMWRFDCVSVVITLQKLQRGLRRLTGKIGLGEKLLRYIDTLPYFLYKCKCQPPDDNDRHYITVKSTHAR